MILWVAVLLGLGLLSILDATFNYGAVFRVCNSIMFLLVALGLLARVHVMSRRGHKEQLERNNDRLRERMMEIRNSLDAIKKGEPIDELRI